MSEFHYEDILAVKKPVTPYRLLTSQYVSEVQTAAGTFLKVDSQGIELLIREAMRDVSHLLRSRHLEQLSSILKDPEASDNDRFVAWELLKNAVIAADFVLPSCQDTGTAIVLAKKGQFVLTQGDDHEAIARGVYKTYQQSNLRYSQMAPLDLFQEKNTGTNLPAQIEILATEGGEYEFICIAKGGGSANKTFLFQETKALLNPEKLTHFLEQKLKLLGTSACPPYHLVVVIGGLSAEHCLKVAKLASVGELDGLPESGNAYGRAFRDGAWEKQILKLTQKTGIGAQFGGKYFCHDVRVVRLPRHGASCPVGIAVSCSADRQILGKINRQGIFLEELERNPLRYLPEITEEKLVQRNPQSLAVTIDLNRPMREICQTLAAHSIGTRLKLTGPMIVARDIAHAKIKERLDRGEPMPEYMKNFMIYYAGPAKTPPGLASGSFGPTTAGRMDSYVELFQSHGGSLITLAKGNRSAGVAAACKKYGGFYLGSIGGPAARLGADCIRKVEVLEYPELGMEAIWKIEVENFPAFIVIDSQGNDFFSGMID